MKHKLTVRYIHMQYPEKTAERQHISEARNDTKTISAKGIIFELLQFGQNILISSVNNKIYWRWQLIKTRIYQ